MTNPLGSNIQSPCKDCSDRHPACHDSCERYIDYKNLKNEQMSYTQRMNAKMYKTAINNAYSYGDARSKKIYGVYKNQYK